MKKFKRIFLVLIAFIVSIVIFYFVDLVSQNTRGPISSTMKEIQKALLGDSVNLQDSLSVQEVVSDTIKRKHLNVSIENLKNPKKILIGYSGSSISSIPAATMEMDNKLGVRNDIVQIYAAWGSKINEQFPKKQVSDIISVGSIPLVTWEPWLSDFSDEIPNQVILAKRETNPLKAIYSGVYDQYIRTWAIEAKRMKSPIYLRFAHEMNDPYRYPWGPHNNEPGDFKKAWIHVHQIFEEVEADNVIWMWSIHSAYSGYTDYYPGSQYVDIIATGILNFGSAVYWSKWWNFEELFAPHYNELSSFKKPIFIVEFGSLKVGGDRPKWYKKALNSIPQAFKNVKGIIFFNFPSDKTLTDKSVSWELEFESNELRTIQQILQNWKKSNFLNE